MWQQRQQEVVDNVTEVTSLSLFSRLFAAYLLFHVTPQFNQWIQVRWTKWLIPWILFLTSDGTRVLFSICHRDIPYKLPYFLAFIIWEFPFASFIISLFRERTYCARMYLRITLLVLWKHLLDLTQTTSKCLRVRPYNLWQWRINRISITVLQRARGLHSNTTLLISNTIQLK